MVRQANPGGVTVVTSGLLAIGCSPTTAHQSTSPTPHAVACSLSLLQPGPPGFQPYGLARAGPLWFSAFGRVSPGSPATLGAGGGPYDGWKVVIHLDPSAQGLVYLSGKSCQSGAAIRFCYEPPGCNWNSRRAGPLILPVDTRLHGDYTGYMVFPGPGLMRLSVTNGHANLGAVVVDVPVTR